MLARALAPSRARASPPRGSPRPPGSLARPLRRLRVGASDARAHAHDASASGPPSSSGADDDPGTPPRARPHSHSHSHSHDDDLEDASDAVTTEHGSPLWRDFVLACTGDWGGCCVSFDACGVPLDIPLRYVHGVGRVPAANMPFREEVTDWMTKCETVATDDGVELRARRAMPEIGNEDAIGSCGGAEWGEDVAFVEEDPVRVLRGAGEDKTILPDGTFSAGARRLPLHPGEVTAVQHCVANPSDASERVRVVHKIRRVRSDWETVSVDAWLERRGPKCVAPFANERRVGLDELADADAWEIVPEKSAVYYLMWPEEEDPRAGPDGGSAFTMLADAGAWEDVFADADFLDGDEEEKEEEKEGKEDESDESDAEGSSPTEDAFVGDAPSSPSSFPPRGLIRLPLGAWAFCGACDGAESGVGSGGEAGQLVVECGWAPVGERERTVASRAYDRETGRLDTVGLARETRRRNK